MYFGIEYASTDAPGEWVLRGWAIRAGETRAEDTRVTTYEVAFRPLGARDPAAEADMMASAERLWRDLNQRA